MGTFHNGLGDLHGVTVVVDTHGSRVYVGRCWVEQPDGIVLVDADVHDEGPGLPSKVEYLQKAARFGVWKKLDQVKVPAEEVASVRLLGAIGV